MEKIIVNACGLKEEEMTDFTTKVKLLLLNSKNELLLGYANHIYQFPGGTQEPEETLIDTINREIREETGILLNLSAIEPFAISLGYYKDHPEMGRNKKVTIHYYEVKTDSEPNFENMDLTDDEKAGNFELRYIALEDVIEEIERNALEYGDYKGIAREMKQLLQLYLSDKKII